ncbi:DUF4179 domain-containing protein [Gordonibacter sp.]|uniref:DUF4179 domain-containing protein n=1 Tax=Gordonibacter sp. TaxID=1968902 RepID=UPI002FC7685F
MTPENLNEEHELKRAVRRAYDVPMPAKAQVKLEEAYASLRSVPQERAETAVPGPASTGDRSGAASTAERSSAGREPVRPTVRRRPTRAAQGEAAQVGKRVVKRSAVVAIAAALVVLLGGTAFAASSLLQMKAGDVPFFQSGSNLPIYNSLQAGVASLNTEVGQSAVVDDMTVTLDTVSTDRNIINLFFTIEKEGGFDLAAESIYEGSNENEWTRLQQIMPLFSQAQITSAGELLCKSDVNKLDAYREGDKVKCLMRIVPGVVLPDEVGVLLTDMVKPQVEGGELTECTLFEVGLDLSTVAQPDELGAQDIVFQTSEGEKTLGIKRFTRSELGTVFIVRNDEVETIEEGGRPVYHPSDTSMLPQLLKMTDDQGSALNFVNAGDGMGYSPAADYVMELSGMSKDAQSVTFTPMALTQSAREAGEPDAIDKRKALNEANPAQEVDVSQIGAQLPTTEYGGYEITSWKVSDNTVSIGLKPYGWAPEAFRSAFELHSVDTPTALKDEYTDPETGETYGGYHTAVQYHKYDYLTGEQIQMTSYYAAGDNELQNLHLYSYRTSFGHYLEESAAAQTLPFVART